MDRPSSLEPGRMAHSAPTGTITHLCLVAQLLVVVEERMVIKTLKPTKEDSQAGHCPLSLFPLKTSLMNDLIRTYLA